MLRHGGVFVATTAAAALVAVLILGCGGSDAEAPAPDSPEAAPEPTTAMSEKPTCEELAGGTSQVPASYRSKGKELVGDVDGDGGDDRVSLGADKIRPAPCRYLLVVESAAGSSIAAPVKPLPWPGTDPELVILAEIDGRSGVEPVIALSPEAVYRPGAVFAMRDGELRRMRLVGSETADLFPFYDEFPAGVDCAGEPAAIVVGGAWRTGERTTGTGTSRDPSTGPPAAASSPFAPRSSWSRSAPRRWPEVLGEPFLSCAGRVD